MEGIDSVDYDALNVDLLEIYKRKKDEESSSSYRTRVFAYSTNAKNNESDLFRYLNSLK